ncbi:MAG TPA: GNAT family N-acetyltransferase [Candidatus Competibacter sp.]|nr:hypothetical protein [Candidatus Competibacteraceae bacterium]HUM95254.1 GNAT family N-acetyltransferase [Candidatus Competibacter sp.]
MKEGPFCGGYDLTGCCLTPPREEDAQVIAAQMVQMDPWRTLNYSAAALQSYILAPDPGLHRYAVRVDDAVSGVIAVRYPWLRGAYLELIGVFPDRQNQGLGAALLDWLERETAARAANLWVLVSGFNHAAQRFYLRQGFHEIGAIDSLVSAGSAELLLRKVLRRLE